MNLRNLAQANLNDAQMRLRTAREVLRQGEFHFCVRLSQEAVELALKAVLRFINIDPPKWHDIGVVLKNNVDKFPDWFRQRISNLSAISASLRNERERSMYGDEDTHTPAQELYTTQDAETALFSTQQVIADCAELLNKL
jgi:HEPN domain-containing protein